MSLRQSKQYGCVTTASQALAIRRAVLEVLESRQHFSLAPFVHGASTAIEGKPYQVTLSTAFGGVDHWTVNWNDGSAVQTVVPSDPDESETFASHPFATVGPKSVSATAYDENGTPYTAKTWAIDVGYGTSGRAAVASLPVDSLIAVDLSGRTILACVVGTSVTVARLTTAGVLDTTFDSDGVATIDLGSGETISAVTADSTGRVVVAGTVGGGMVIGRLTAAGAPDATFDSDGVANVSFASGSAATAVAATSSNDIVVAGNLSDTAQSFAMAKLDSSGQLVDGFATHGLYTHAFAAAALAKGLAISSAGKIIAAIDLGNGTAAPNVARFDSAGAIDTTYGNAGFQTADRTGTLTSLALSNSTPTITLEANSNVYLGILGDSMVLGGVLFNASSRSQLATASGKIYFSAVDASGETHLVRYTAQFNPDPTFGIGGALAAGPAGAASARLAVAGVKLLLTSSNASGLAVARYTGDVTQLALNVRRDFGLVGSSGAGGSPSALTLTSTNTDANVASTWLIDWKDGTTETKTVYATQANPAVVYNTYAVSTADYAVTATASDAVATQSVGPTTIYVDGPLPRTPANFSVNLTAGGYLVFSWQQSGTSATNYVIEVSGDGVSGWTAFNPTGPLNSGMTDAAAVTTAQEEVGFGNLSTAPDLRAIRRANTGRQHFFRLRAVNAAGPSDESAVVRAATPAEDGVVKASAVALTGPNRIVLSWQAASNRRYAIYRRAPGGSWPSSPLATTALAASSYTDTAVALATPYEYRIEAVTAASVPTGVKTYLSSGIQLPLVEGRGKLILLVDDNGTLRTQLVDKLRRLQEDLTGDGWTVIRHDVPLSLGVAGVKKLIHDDYLADPSNVKQVLLFGHIAVPYSGNYAPDGHTSPDYNNHYTIGAWPTDAYYADMTGSYDNGNTGSWTDTYVDTRNNVDWNGHPLNPTYAENLKQVNIPGDGKFDQTALSGDFVPELAVGRVDLADMGSDEVTLLGRYLDKDHDFRTGAVDIRQRALIDSNISSVPYATAAYRNYSSLVGDAQLDIGEYGVEGKADSYLWGWGDGYGYYDSAAGVGSTADFLSDTPKSKVVFNALFGSYFGNFDTSGSFLRAPLAGPGLGLASYFGSNDTWFGSSVPTREFWQMGMGATLGDGMRFTQIGGPEGLPSNITTNLMGDPTLRMAVVKPATNVTAAPGVGGTTVAAWTASPQAGLAGYNVYRANSMDGPFTRLNASGAYITGTSFTDTTAGTGHYVYMVRAVKLEQSNTGSYYNASTGAFFDDTTTLTVGDDDAYRGFVQRSYVGKITLTFGTPVTLAQTNSGNPGDGTPAFGLVNRGTESDVPYTFSTPDNGRTYVITPLSGSFGDGVYDLFLYEDNVIVNATGQQLGSGMQTFSFYRLGGDANADHTVNFNDFLILQNEFGSTSPTGFYHADTDGDHDVDFDDFLVLQANFGQSIVL